jgi:DNA-binding TFAR19-related protein (PDSD5 family)
MARTTNAARVNKANSTANKRNMLNPNMKAIQGGRSNTLQSQSGHAKSEKSAQTGIERMQQAVEKGQFAYDALVSKASKELERIKKVTDYLTLKGVKPVSEYGTLKKIYDRDLAHLTREHYDNDAENAAIRFMSKFRGTITEAQKKVIIEYHYGKAGANFKVVDNIRLLLVQKGQIKDEKTAKEIEKGLEEVTKGQPVPQVQPE